jgi:hypothetical protein
MIMERTMSRVEIVPGPRGTRVELALALPNRVLSLVQAPS